MVLAGLLAPRTDTTLRCMFRVSLVERDVDTGISTIVLRVSSTFHIGLFPSSRVASSESEVHALG